jgi:hypothetical protein
MTHFRSIRTERADEIDPIDADADRLHPEPPPKPRLLDQVRDAMRTRNAAAQPK